MFAKKKIRVSSYIFILMLGMFFASCAANSKGLKDEADGSKIERSFFAMDTYMKATAYGPAAEDAVSQAEAEVRRLEALFSTELENSDIAGLNQKGYGAVSPETSSLIQYSLELHAKTGGAFNIAIYPLMEAWGFPSQNYQVPADEMLQELLSLTDISHIVIEEGLEDIHLGEEGSEDIHWGEESPGNVHSGEEGSENVRFGIEGMKIDLGGIAKGYASSQIIEIWKEAGVESGLVTLGGNVHALGAKPDGSPWRIAIQSPSKDGYLGILSIQDKAVITSGGYERYFEQNGITYHHIIDPADGYPADNGLVSVTIVSGNGTLADALSTALFVMGQEKAFEFWRQNSEEFDFILLSEDGTLSVSEGIAASFTSDFEFQIIEKDIH